MRSNPLNIIGQPKGFAVLAVAGGAAIVLAGAGLVTSKIIANERAANVRTAVAAAGYGSATVTPIKGDECWRGREGFGWRTPTASGSACAGPRAEVRLFPGQAVPRL